MIISATQFKAKCLEVIDKMQKEKSRVIITRHGDPADRTVAQASKGFTQARMAAARWIWTTRRS